MAISDSDSDSLAVSAWRREYYRKVRHREMFSHVAQPLEIANANTLLSGANISFLAKKS